LELFKDLDDGGTNRFIEQSWGATPWYLFSEEGFIF
jgi:hypothetical protein